MHLLVSFTAFIMPLIWAWIHLRGTNAAARCESPQYLELEKVGTVSCSFHEEFYAVLWYTAADLEGRPTLSYQNEIKTGGGYESGEFDIHSNGSLIINNVSLDHNDMFTVAYIHFKGERHIFIHISVIVVVKPEVSFPVINYCGNVSNICYTEVDVPLVECTVQGARPNISLDLVATTSEGDKTIPGDTFVNQEGIGYTTRFTARNIFHYSNLLVLLLCKASSEIEILAHDKSIVMIQNGAIDISHREVTLQYVERGTELEIACANDDVGFLVWKNEPSSSNDQQQNVLLYALFIGKQVTKVVQSDVMLGRNGSLVIPTVDVQHEGRYSCVYGDGMSNDVLVYDVVVVENIPQTKAVSILTWVIPVIVAFLLLLLLCGLLIKKLLGSGTSIKRTKKEGEEDLPNSEANSFTGDDLEGNKNRFLKELKEKYKDLYDAVQPIPYIKDRLYCVDRVFVEGGIEFLDSYKGETMGNWKNLDSYQNVFNDQRVQSSRRILEGEPGYGKSTVTLQFAYDWCNSKDSSALKDVEIMILLKLRQMGGVSSIYRAIKQFILPKDTLLNEKDIEKIMRNCTSAVVILDGMDEYPDQDITSASDVMNIIARQMFQDIDVLTTTRSSFLPKKYPALTKRLRLTGFDDSARRYYIRKAVVGDDDEERVQEIEESLEENPILSDLCQVPLLFVIFAHMTHDRGDFRKLNSVTSFFRYVILCFHSHMRNKMDEENVRKYELFESEHHDLDKAAFDALCSSSQKIVWKKDDLGQILGPEFYDQYVRTGILVEEEIIDIIDDPGSPIAEHVQYKTEVRFYHKLFCEWYAAHYLSSYLQQNADVNLSEFLQHLDPFDVQYMYRFSCGLNTDTAEQIITYLKNIEGGDKFAILCILEQTERVDHIKETIRELCFEGIVISGHDSLLLQRSSMQLLGIAARNDIPIEFVRLSNCLQSVDLSASAIRITSGLALTSRIPVKVLVVSLYNRNMTKDEAIDILQFASTCHSLRELGISACQAICHFHTPYSISRFPKFPEIIPLPENSRRAPRVPEFRVISGTVETLIPIYVLWLCMSTRSHLPVYAIISQIQRYERSFRGLRPLDPHRGSAPDPVRGPGAGAWTPRVQTRASRSWCTFSALVTLQCTCHTPPFWWRWADNKSDYFLNFQTGRWELHSLFEELELFSHTSGFPFYFGKLVHDQQAGWLRYRIKLCYVLNGIWLAIKRELVPSRSPLEARKLSEQTKNRKGCSEETYKGWVAKGRRELREEAEKKRAELRDKASDDKHDSGDVNVSKESEAPPE
ncbi:NLR family CARD domain-containing protein 4 [Holothuria leucospilota]|uniref:NLR family CARD domain-containing protein 4 n=1 Tax=Holothuria leucospilota TaxID=206669 RepID=A0A9Q1BS95_HOLLE|nr:NLR family CARD domain-containing protein 4 [Holothuria leucospilota]